MSEAGPNKIAQAVESMWAKGLARLLTPILLALMGYLGIEVRSDTRESLRLSQTNSLNIAVIQARLDAIDKAKK